MTDREPIEAYLRDEHIDDEAIVVVRGGPVTTEKFVEHALRQAREFTFRSAPMYSISVNLTVGGWDLDALLAGPDGFPIDLRHGDGRRRALSGVRAPADVCGAALRPAPAG